MVPVHMVMVAASFISVHIAACSVTQWDLAPKGSLTSGYSLPLTMITTADLLHHISHLMVTTYLSIAIYCSPEVITTSLLLCNPYLLRPVLLPY